MMLKVTQLLLLIVLQVVVSYNDKELVIKPRADTFVIRQDPHAFMGYHATVNVIERTHFGFFLFDIYDLHHRIRSLHADGEHAPFSHIKVRLRLHVHWAEDSNVKVQLNQVKFARPKWSDASLQWAHTENAALQLIDSTFTSYSSQNLIEFDITDVVLDTVQNCIGKNDCRWLTFRLSAHSWHWIQIISKDNSNLDKHPSMVFSIDPYVKRVRCLSNGFVVRQVPDQIFSQSNALSMYATTHIGFMEFDMSKKYLQDLLDSMDNGMIIQLRLYVEWAEKPQSNLQIDIVELSDSMTKMDLTWTTTMKHRVITHIGTLSSDTGDILEFGLNDALKLIKRRNHEIDFSKLQLRITTGQSSWVKVASEQAVNIEHRPVIVFKDATWWETQAANTLYVIQVLYFMLSPLMSVGAAVILALMLSYLKRTYDQYKVAGLGNYSTSSAVKGYASSSSEQINVKW